MAGAVTEFAVFVFEARELERVFNGEKKLVGCEGFFEEVQSAETGGLDGHLNVGLAGDENDGSLHAGFLEFFKQVEAGFAGHDDVGEDEVEMVVADQFGGAEGVVADGRIVTGEAEGAGKRGESVGVVVNQ